MNKIPDHIKYINIPEFKKLITENFTARLKQVNIAAKCDIADLAKN